MSEGFVKAPQPVPPFTLPADYDQARDRDTPFCGLFGIAVVAGITLAEAGEHYQRVAGPRRGNWKGRTYHAFYGAVLMRLRVKFNCRKLPRPMTLGRFVNYETRPERMYLVRVVGHVMVVKNGIALDQTRCCFAIDHPDRRRRVTNVWEILP